MFQWIQSKKWLPDVVIGGVLVVICALSDYLIQGTNGLIAALLISAAFLFFREYSYLAVGLIITGSAAELFLGLKPTVSGFATALLVFVASALGKRFWSLMILVGTVVSGIVIAWNATISAPLSTQLYGLSFYNQEGHYWAFGFTAVSIIGLNGFAWLLGGFLIEFYKERQASIERDIVTRHNLRAALELAEQSSRFKIASDINETALEQFSAMLTITDGARYASRIDAGIASRTLDRLSDLLRQTHDEMRRLYDALNHSLQVAASPPNLQDLQTLAIQLRQSGYQTKVSHQGTPIRLIPSAELNIYRIVFDAVENVTTHAPEGTSIAIDLIWSENGLQVLVKDNGDEVNRAQTVNLELTGEEEAEADLLALTQEASGAGITGMRERAALFGGNVEARHVPGIGFTVNALFPGIEQHRADQA